MNEIKDKEMVEFCEDLLISARQVKERSGHIVFSPVANIRKKANLSQSKFATLMGISVRTLQDWEQGRTKPSGAAKTLLKIVEKSPDVLLSVA